MNTLSKIIILSLLAAGLLPACQSPLPVTVTSPPVTTTDTVANEIPTTEPTSTPMPPIETSPPATRQIIYYYFVNPAETPYPEGSVVVMPEAYILAPTPSGQALSADNAADLLAALEFALHDNRNGWTGDKLEIIEVTFGEGHANVVLQGDYYGVGDVTLIAARVQMLLTVFANAAVQTASITLNGDTIGNMGISSNREARPADYVFVRAEMESFTAKNALP